MIDFRCDTNWAVIAKIIDRELENIKQERRDYDTAFSWAESEKKHGRRLGESDDEFRARILGEE